MAVRERKGRASPWQVYWRNPFTHKQECVNFKTKDEALKEDSLIKHRLMFDRESFRPLEEEINEEEELTFKQVYWLYLRTKKFTKNGFEAQYYGMKIPLLLYSHQKAATFNGEMIKIIVEELKKLPVKQTTKRRRAGALKAFLNWSAEMGYMPKFNFPKMELGYYERFIPPTQDELERMFSVAPEHIRRVIILGSRCGVRIGKSELLALTWNNVDFDNALIRIQGAAKNPNAQWREVPLQSSIISLLREWYFLDMTAGINYIINYKGKPVSSIKHSWTNTLKKAGISRRIRPYDLRHAFATELIAAGTDIGTVAKLMGHSSPMMVYKHYQYILDSQKKAAVNSLPQFNLNILNKESCMPKDVCPNKNGFTEVQ